MENKNKIEDLIDLTKAPEMCLEVSSELINPLQSKGITQFKSDEDVTCKTWEVINLTSKHHKLIRLAASGFSNPEIAEKLGTKLSYIRRMRRSILIKDAEKNLKMKFEKDTIDINKRIQELVPKALKNVEEIVESGTLNGEEVPFSFILKESNNILDRGLGKATQTNISANLNVHFSEKELKQIKEKADQVSKELKDE